MEAQKLIFSMNIKINGKPLNLSVCQKDTLTSIIQRLAYFLQQTNQQRIKKMKDQVVQNLLSSLASSSLNSKTKQKILIITGKDGRGTDNEEQVKQDQHKSTLSNKQTDFMNVRENKKQGDKGPDLTKQQQKGKQIVLRNGNRQNSRRKDWEGRNKIKQGEFTKLYKIKKQIFQESKQNEALQGDLRKKVKQKECKWKKQLKQNRYNFSLVRDKNKDRKMSQSQIFDRIQRKLMKYDQNYNKKSTKVLQEEFENVDEGLDQSKSSRVKDKKQGFTDTSQAKFKYNYDQIIEERIKKEKKIDGLEDTKKIDTNHLFPKNRRNSYKYFGNLSQTCEQIQFDGLKRNYYKQQEQKDKNERLKKISRNGSSSSMKYNYLQSMTMGDSRWRTTNQYSQIRNSVKNLLGQGQSLLNSSAGTQRSRNKSISYQSQKRFRYL